MVQVIKPHSGVLADRSGTIAQANTSQLLAAANADRKYLLVQNNSTGDLWLNFSNAATVGQPSIKIAAGGVYIMEHAFVTNEPIYIIGATAGQAFTAKEA